MPGEIPHHGARGTTATEPLSSRLKPRDPAVRGTAPQRSARLRRLRRPRRPPASGSADDHRPVAVRRRSLADPKRPLPHGRVDGVDRPGLGLRRVPGSDRPPRLLHPQGDQPDPTGPGMGRPGRGGQLVEGPAEGPLSGLPKREAVKKWSGGDWPGETGRRPRRRGSTPPPGDRPGASCPTGGAADWWGRVRHSKHRCS